MDCILAKKKISYRQELTEAMTWLGWQPDTIFIGQQLRFPGNSLFPTLEGVPMEKRIEFPVAEEMQLGASIGIALTGKTVISIFPRMDFLICAMNQLVNHLDKLEDFTHGQYKASVILRAGIGSTIPLNPGVQHCSDYSSSLQQMLKNIPVLVIGKEDSPLKLYQYGYWLRKPVLFVEVLSLYGMG